MVQDQQPGGKEERQRSHYTPLKIFWTLVDKVSNCRYLRVHTAENLTWTANITSVVKKAKQHLYHLRRLRKIKISSGLQKTLFSAAIQSVISGSIITWYGNWSTQNRKSLHRGIPCTECITRTALPCH